jgi:hypothetical protein
MDHLEAFSTAYAALVHGGPFTPVLNAAPAPPSAKRRRGKQRLAVKLRTSRKQRMLLAKNHNVRWFR